MAKAKARQIDTNVVIIGGAFAIGDPQLQNSPRKITPEEGQPRVQFETRFKF